MVKLKRLGWCWYCTFHHTDGHKGFACNSILSIKWALIIESGKRWPLICSHYVWNAQQYSREHTQQLNSIQCHVFSIQASQVVLRHPQLTTTEMWLCGVQSIIKWHLKKWNSNVFFPQAMSRLLWIICSHLCGLDLKIVQMKAQVNWQKCFMIKVY